MKRPISPCKKSGVDCTKRHVGCRSDCPDWQVYEQDQKEYRSAESERFKQYQVVKDYFTANITKTLHLKKQQGRK